MSSLCPTTHHHQDRPHRAPRHQARSARLLVAPPPKGGWLHNLWLPHVGTAGSAPTCVCSPQGAVGLPPSATAGHRSSIDSCFNKQAVRQEPSIMLKKYNKLKMELTIGTPTMLFGTGVLAWNRPAQYLQTRCLHHCRRSCPSRPRNCSGRLRCCYWGCPCTLGYCSCRPSYRYWCHLSCHS